MRRHGLLRLGRYLLLCVVAAFAVFALMRREERPNRVADGRLGDRLRAALRQSGASLDRCEGVSVGEWEEEHGYDDEGEEGDDSTSTHDKASSLWHRFTTNISKCYMYGEDDADVEKILKDMANLEITKIESLKGGSQMAFVARLSNGERAVMKPGRFDLDYERSVDTFVFDDMERDYAEVAAFHLDRLLGFRRAVPTCGRWIDLANEFAPVASKDIKNTIYISPAYEFDNNKTQIQLDDAMSQVCVYGDCRQHCNRINSFCGHPNMTHVSMQMFLPRVVKHAAHTVSPFKGLFSGCTQFPNSLRFRQHDLAENSSYVGNKLLWRAPATKSEDYCNRCVKRQPLYAHGPSLPFIVDTAIFDYLIGNWDRHSHQRLSLFDVEDESADSDLFVMHSDHGRAFGRHSDDDEELLAALRQCCVIHPRTLHTLLDLYDGEFNLTQALRQSLSHDDIAPVLADAHFPALDRRLHRILLAVDRCVEQAVNPADVIRSTYDNQEITDDYVFTEYEQNCTNYR